MNEADTCRTLITPRLQNALWENEPHQINEQVAFTNGRIVVEMGGSRATRGEKKRADYILRHHPNFPIAVVEAKPDGAPLGEGMQQAKEYAEILGIKFAYACNGSDIVEFDYTTGQERELQEFPTPVELWSRLIKSVQLSADASAPLLAPFHDFGEAQKPRYYQETAINRVVQEIIRGQKRILLTMATGTGKTVVAFQICWKLWNARWNLESAHRRPRMLYLSDRSVLIDDPMEKVFAPFEKARWKIQGSPNQSRNMYFALYQSLAQDENRPGLYREYPRDFFDLVIVDECHRGSSNEKGNWREILDYFSPAAQLGMTATPLREDNRDTYSYFGNPIYTYSLHQGIEDGFLAPYRVHRVITQWDAAGWRPSKGDTDRYGREIPDETYQTPDFERTIAMRARTNAVARHLTTHLKETNRYDKTIIFCVDQEHAGEMRRALSNFNADITQQHPNYVCRVTSSEGDIGRAHLGNFQDLEKPIPAILTTSHLLTTGVDAPTVKNVVLMRVIRSMTEFKQIIGRGTRVREDYGKSFFNILDYTGSATQMFADPEFDGEPDEITEDKISDGEIIPDNGEIGVMDSSPENNGEETPILLPPAPAPLPDKFYFDGGEVDIATHMVYELDSDGRQLRVVKLTDYTAEKIRTLYRGGYDELRLVWANPLSRMEMAKKLQREYGINLAHLADAMKRPEADGLDLLCHLAFESPLQTRSERARRLRSAKEDFFEHYAPPARAVLHELLEQYTDHGVEQFTLPEGLQVPPLNQRGNLPEIAALFDGVNHLREAVNKMQELLYAA